LVGDSFCPNRLRVNLLKQRMDKKEENNNNNDFTGMKVWFHPEIREKSLLELVVSGMSDIYYQININHMISAYKIS